MEVVLILKKNLLIAKLLKNSTEIFWHRWVLQTAYRLKNTDLVVIVGNILFRNTFTLGCCSKCDLFLNRGLSWYSLNLTKLNVVCYINEIFLIQKVFELIDWKFLWHSWGFPTPYLLRNTDLVVIVSKTWFWNRFTLGCCSGCEFF